MLRVGHRGAAALAAANSLESMSAALEHGVDMVEIDVARAAHGALALAHDADDVGPDAPSLDEALGFFCETAGPDVTIDLDLKIGDGAGQVADALRGFGLLERSIVTALHDGWLVDIRSHEPRVTTGLSYPHDRAGLSERRLLRPLVKPGTSLLRRVLPLRVVAMVARAQANALMLHHAVVSAATVRRCAAQGVPVFAWTVDDLETARAMVAAGVRGVISNDPHVLKEI